MTVFACENLEDAFNTPKLGILIGNAKYANSALLTTVHNDIEAILGQLKKNGYEIDCYENLPVADLKQLFERLGSSLPTYRGDLVLYLSGHGWNDGTDSFFLGTDTNLRNPLEYKQGSINLDDFVVKLSRSGPRQAVLIFDICRDNPTGEIRLATPKYIEKNFTVAKDVIVAYSAGYGTVAPDDEPGRRVSPYAGALAFWLKPEWGLSVQEILGFVNSTLNDQAKARQYSLQTPSFVSLAARDILLDTRYTGLKGLRSPDDLDNIGAKPIYTRELDSDIAKELKEGGERRSAYKGFSTLIRSQLSGLCRSRFNEADRRYGSRQVAIYRMPREIFDAEWVQELQEQEGFKKTPIKGYLVFSTVLEPPCLNSSEGSEFNVIGTDRKTGKWTMYLDESANGVFVKSTGHGMADIIFTRNNGLDLQDVILYEFDLNEWRFLRETQVTVSRSRKHPFTQDNEQREWLGLKPYDEEVPSTPAMASVPSPAQGLPRSPMFQKGLADRTEWETWVSGLARDYRAGADYWAGQRPFPHPGNCEGSPEFVTGCATAKQRLAPIDALRKSEPDYRLGWNAYAH